MDIAEIIRNLKDRYWGLPAQDIDWLVQSDLPKPAINISTVSDYKRACSLYGEMEKMLGKTNGDRLWLYACSLWGPRLGAFRRTMRRRTVTRQRRANKTKAPPRNCLNGISGVGRFVPPCIV